MASWVPSDEDWDRYQDRIKQLYLVENKTLKNVIESMENEYSFKATVKMFKNRLTKWGFDQKYKKRRASNFQPSKRRRGSITECPPNVQAVLRKDFSDDEQRGKRARTRSRHSQSLTAIAAGGEMRQFPETDDCLPKGAAIPHTLMWDELLLCEISYYFCASFRSKLWFSEGQDRQCRSIKATEGVDLSISKLAVRLSGTFGNHHLRLLQALEKSSDAKGFVNAEFPETIPDLIELSLRLIKRGDCEDVRNILKQFHKASAALNTKSASIYRILAEYSTRDCLMFEQVVAKAWRFIIHQFQHFLGDVHLTTLRCHVRWLRYFAGTSVCDIDICSSKCGHVEHSQTVLTNLLKKCDEDCLPKSTRSGMVLQTKVNILLAERAYTEVEGTCRQIMTRTGVEYENPIFITALESLSVAQCKQGKFAEAERNLRKLVDLSANSWGWDECRTRYYMERLGECAFHSAKGGEAFWELPFI